MEFKLNQFPEKWEPMLLSDFNWTSCTTRYLLKLRDDIRQGNIFQFDGIYRDEKIGKEVNEKYAKVQEIVYDLLATREHVLNKLEAQAARRRKAKEQRNR